MGKPVLANAKCDVLQGQCLRSNAGLFYANYAEFAETMGAIDTTPSLQAALGRNGRNFFEKHYAWPVIEKKYVDMLQQLSKETVTRTMEPMPGWLSRRRKSQPPADGVVKKLPSGAYRESKTVGSQPSATGSQPTHSPRPPAVSSQPNQVARPSQSARPDQRNFRDSRGRRPDQRPPRQDNRPKTESRPNAEGRQPKADGGPPKAESREPRAEGNQRRDHRRGRPQRRGRRPGGGGGAR
jgi:hypothetical protein